MCMLAVACGVVVGKAIIHGLVLGRLLRLKMFRANQGSWMVQFFTVVGSLFLFSHAYNVILVLSHPAAKRYTIDSSMYLTSSRCDRSRMVLTKTTLTLLSFLSVMKAAACGSWLGALFTGLIVTDMMLQDNLYLGFAPTLRYVSVYSTSASGWSCIRQSSLPSGSSGRAAPRRASSSSG